MAKGNRIQQLNAKLDQLRRRQAEIGRRTERLRVDLERRDPDNLPNLVADVEWLKRAIPQLHHDLASAIRDLIEAFPERANEIRAEAATLGYREDELESDQRSGAPPLSVAPATSDSPLVHATA